MAAKSETGSRGSLASQFAKFLGSIYSVAAGLALIACIMGVSLHSIGWLRYDFSPPDIAHDAGGSISMLVSHLKWGAENPGAIVREISLLLIGIAMLKAALNMVASLAFRWSFPGSIQLGLLPRMRILHTSAEHAGQIYMPSVNSMLLVGVLLLVALFGSSSKLANAYGIAVTGTMVVTATLALIVVHKHWRWPLLAAVALITPFLVIDVIFLGANLMKVHEGGYVPLLIACVVMIAMRSWWRGTEILEAKARESDLPIGMLLRRLDEKPPVLVPGTAVYLTAQPDLAPVALLHSLKHFKALHEHNVILTIRTADTPRVADEDRVEMHDINRLFRQVTLRFGYMEEPNVPKGLLLCRKLGWKFDIMSTSFLVSRRSLKPSTKSDMHSWQRALFIYLSRNAAGATDYFHIPAGRVVEIGAQVNI